MHERANLLPFLFAALGVALLSMMDGFMKQASLAAGAYTATLLRSLIAAALVTPIWLARGASWPRGQVMRLHLERGVVSAFMALSWFFALTRLPLAEAIAISFVAPLIALYFARILLAETISRGSVYASVLGFVGTLVIVGGRLGRQGFDHDLLLGLGSLFFSALLYAYNFVVIRKQSQVAGPLEVATFHSGVGGLVLLVAAPFLFTMPQTGALQSLGMAAVLTVGGSMAVSWAYARAQAQALVPLEYTGFLWAAWIGWQFFDEAITLTTLAGAVLIVLGSWIAAPRRSGTKA